MQTVVDLVTKLQDGKLELADAWSNLERFELPKLEN